MKKATVCFSLVVLAAALVASASAGGVPFCDTAGDKVLCGQLVGGAKTWAEAMTNALNGAQRRAAPGKSVTDVVVAKLPAGLQPQTTDSIVKSCQWAYDNIKDNINECIGFVKDDPTYALKYHLSALTYSDCTMALDEFNLTVPEATQFEGEMNKLCSALLAVAEKKP